MFLELIATFAAGFGAAGLVLALNVITKGRLPKWAMPVAAGLAMIGVGVANEYSWGDRTKAALPEGVEIVSSVDQKNWWRPWTYIAPQTTRFAAIDTQTFKTNPKADSVKLVDLYVFARWQPPAKVPQLIDCATGMRADATSNALNDPAAAAWLEAEAEWLGVVCEDPSEG